MAIKGLSEARRLPRIGKIHLGIKVDRGDGTVYPKATDYFVFPEQYLPDLDSTIGETKPKTLTIYFPSEDPEMFTSQFYRAYSNLRGLVCKGDGEKAQMLVDTKTGQLSTRESKKVEWRTVPCPGRECVYYGARCKETMYLQVLLPDLPGLGVWQIDTGSINNIISINSALDLIRTVAGRVSFIPLELSITHQDVAPEGVKKSVHVLKLVCKETLAEIRRVGLLPVGQVLIPEAAEPEPGEYLETDDIPTNVDPLTGEIFDEQHPEESPVMTEEQKPAPIETAPVG